MTAELPIPFTPADCDLRDFLFMPLDVLRLRDSEISVLSSGDEFRCAVLLWCASWHQIPAASLPDDDIVLAGFAGFGRVVKEWKKVKTGALRGWIKCRDGRLYHPVVSEKANEAWAGRLEYREKKEAERVRKAAVRAAQKAAEEAARNAGKPQDDNNLSDGQDESVRRTNGDCPPENGLRGTVDSGQRTVDSGQGKLTKTKSSDTSNSVGPAGAGKSDDSTSIRIDQIVALLQADGIQPISDDHPLVERWASNPKITDALLKGVVAKARKFIPDKQISPNYLAPIITEQLAPKPDNSWQKSDQATDAMARKLGITPGQYDSYPDLRAKISDELRRLKHASQTEGSIA